MNAPPIVTRILLAFCVLAWVTAQGQQLSTTLVQLGDQTITIPTPKGFEEASRFESVKKLFTATEAPDADVLAIHLTTTDVQRLNRGEQALLDFYAKVSVQRTARNQVSTSATFAAIKDQMRKNSSAIFDINSPAIQLTLKNADKGLSEINERETKVDMSPMTVLGEFQNTSNIYATLVMLNVKVHTDSAETQTKLVCSLSFVLANERVIFVCAYRKYKTQQDAALVAQFAKQWNNEIVAANTKP